MEKEANQKKYIVYCTVNNVDKSVYIGVHKTGDKFDGYLGSGVYINEPYTYKYSKTAFQCAVNKYGCKNFTRYTIAESYNYNIAHLIEELILTKPFLIRKDVYNTVEILNNNNPIYLYSVTGEYIKDFENPNQLANYLDLSPSEIIEASLTGFCLLKSYYVSTIQEQSYDRAHTKYIKTRPVSCYNPNTGVIIKYESQPQAEKENKKMNITKSIKLKSADKNGNFWTPD